MVPQQCRLPQSPQASFQGLATTRTDQQRKPGLKTEMSQPRQGLLLTRRCFSGSSMCDSQVGFFKDRDAVRGLCPAWTNHWLDGSWLLVQFSPNLSFFCWGTHRSSPNYKSVRLRGVAELPSRKTCYLPQNSQQNTKSMSNNVSSGSTFTHCSHWYRNTLMALGTESS